MRLLIAEDEEYTREGLIESIPWSNYGITEIMEARDGNEALKISLWFKPDIVITDIKMPKMSGIEFAEKLIKQCLESKLLFISGYLDINFLKSAIQLSAVDYIEKPINLKSVEQAVKKAVNSINEKRKQDIINARKNELELQKLASTLKYNIKDKDLIYRICGQIGLSTRKNYIVAVIWNRERLYSQEENIKKINDFWKQNKIMSICTYIEREEYFVIIEVGEREEKRVNKLCEKFIEQEKTLTMGVGFCVNSLISISESYKVAMFNVNRSFYNEEIRLFTLDDKILNEKNIDYGIYSEFNTVLKTPQKLTGWLEELFQKLCMQECYGKEPVKNLFFTFSKTIIQEKNILITRLEGISGEIDLEEFIMNTTTIFQIKNFLMYLAREYQKETEKSYSYSKVVRDIIEYINSHYSEADLSVEAMADFVHLSSAHLSVLFKQETGTTLKQYIGDYRIELSKKLLANEHYKINEIAELCGYSNANYFAKVFKAATELSPIEYRNKCFQG